MIVRWVIVWLALLFSYGVALPDDMPALARRKRGPSGPGRGTPFKRQKATRALHRMAFARLSP
jgi:hypothetical protein